MLSVAQLGPILFSSKFTTSELSKSNRRIAGSRASDGSNDNWDLNPPTHLLSHEWNLSAQQLGRRLEKVRKEFGVVFVDAKLLSRYFVLQNISLRTFSLTGTACFRFCYRSGSSNKSCFRNSDTDVAGRNVVNLGSISARNVVPH